MMKRIFAFLTLCLMVSAQFAGAAPCMMGSCPMMSKHASIQETAEKMPVQHKDCQHMAAAGEKEKTCNHLQLSDCVKNGQNATLAFVADFSSAKQKVNFTPAGDEIAYLALQDDIQPVIHERSSPAVLAHHFLRHGQSLYLQTGRLRL